MASNYVSPVPPGIAVKRSDQGRDYQGTPGQRIVAIGRARVDAVKDDPGGFGKAIYYTLLDGPSKGQQIYVGHAQPSVRAGQVIAAGKPVATLLKSSLGNAAGMPGWVEIGLARGGAPMYPSNGARPLEKLLRGASTAPSTQPDQTTSTAPAVAQALDLNANIAPPTPVPPPTAMGVPSPDVQLPGSVNYAADPQNNTASLWGQVAQGNLVSPETQAMLQNATMTGA